MIKGKDIWNKVGIYANISNQPCTILEDENWWVLSCFNSIGNFEASKKYIYKFIEGVKITDVLMHLLIHPRFSYLQIWTKRWICWISSHQGCFAELYGLMEVFQMAPLGLSDKSWNNNRRCWNHTQMKLREISLESQHWIIVSSSI